MSVLTIDEAKLHQKIDHDDEDEDIREKLEASESMVAHYMGRNIYSDQESLESDFNKIQEIQFNAKNEIENLALIFDIDSDNYKNTAAQKQRDLYQKILMILNGIVINSHIRAGILLTFGYLYEVREDIGDLPQAAKNVIQPFRINLGV